MNDELHLGADGADLCRHYESLRLQAYPDPGSELYKALRGEGIDPYRLTQVPTQFANLSGKPWTIGFGDTGPGVVEGLTITEQEAYQRFARRMTLEFEPMVRRAVRVPLNQRQFDAVVSIFYNVGPGCPGRDGIARLAGGEPSTLLRKINAGDYAGAAAQFPAWNRSGGQILKGLQRRRNRPR